MVILHVLFITLQITTTSDNQAAEHTCRFGVRIDTTRTMSRQHSVFSLFLVVLITDAKVVDNFNQCKEGHFYQGRPPTLEGVGGDLKRICQTYNDVDYFATLYNTRNKIAIYSAYQVRGNVNKKCPDRDSTWRLEPQLDNPNSTLQNMATLGAINENAPSAIVPGTFQAINENYKDSSYDRGHLNPVSHHSDAPCDERTSTNTLTNAVPQHGSFNRGEWSKHEGTARASLSSCDFHGARRFVVTGAVPSSDFISGGVNVPRYMWSAVCCDSSKATDESDRQSGWSYSYYGLNEKNSTTGYLSIQNLQVRLKEWYQLPYEPVIFARLQTPDVGYCAFSENGANLAMESGRLSRAGRRPQQRNGRKHLRDQLSNGSQRQAVKESRKRLRNIG